MHSYNYNEAELNFPFLFHQLFFPLHVTKCKNVFQGDFGVSRLLMGSCDLATTFTGTPFYMSPEALQHHGYDTKSDIW